MKGFKNIISKILLLLSALIIIITFYISLNFKEQGLREIIFHIGNGLKGTSASVILAGVVACIIPLSILLLALSIPLYIMKKKNIAINKFNKVKFNYSLILMIVSFVLSYSLLGGNDYVKAVFLESNFIEENYTDANKVDIKFPEKKQNLILIYSESLENSLLNKNIGGGWSYSLMPELEKIATNNLNFSNTDSIGGFHQIEGTTWTIAGITASTSGLPIKGFALNEYKSENFLGGANALGDVLQKEGYNQQVMMGSSAEFGGKKQFFKNHGNYKIFDYDYAVSNGYMTEEEKVWWGFEDSKLFKWSKEEVKKLASEDKPFNFVIETVNTHFTDGYLEEGAEEKYESQYENVYADSSKQISEFIEWAKKQDFYKNTTIIVLGDHLGMQDKLYEDNMVENYDRTVYNAFINSRVKAKNNKNRNFSTFDLYPTILRSLGAEIEGNKLGLGVDLFSGEKTILEKYGYQFCNEELKKNSEFYNREILELEFEQNKKGR